MPAPRDLKPLDAAALKRIPELKTNPKFELKFPKTAIKPTELKSAQSAWLKSIPAPKLDQPAPKAIKAVALTSAQLDKLRAVTESKAPTAEILAQGLSPDQTLGVLYSSIAALEYTKLAAERKQRLAKATDPAAKAKVEAEWSKAVDGISAAYAAAGLKGLKQPALDKMATELNRKKANFNAVATILNTAEDVLPDSQPGKVLGGYLTHIAVLPDLVTAVIPAPATLCQTPIQGSTTKHFGYSFGLRVRLYVPCPKWTNPFNWCWKTFTIAAVSFSLDLAIGYRITCCGASAWGTAGAQACGTILGVTFCASCTARITGVAGVGRSGSGNSCSYGLGLNAELKCTLAGVTVFYVTVPFGWTVTGPCPPAALPC